MASILRPPGAVHEEIAAEYPSDSGTRFAFAKLFIKHFTFLPYLPAFHSPGWMLRYIVGPYDYNWVFFLFSDFWAGLTIALTLLPQGLSYAVLANLPAINGLYTSILSGASYAFFGSSMTLAVGPVAIVSLMTGSLVAKYVPDPTNHPVEALAAANQAALASGIILCAMSLLNLGLFFNFINHPVMSGFTTAAACLIGLNQLKSAFGFTSNVKVPQLGDEGYHYNYQVFQWFKNNFNDKTLLPKVTYGLKGNYASNFKPYINPYAYTICFSLYFSLMFLYMIKTYLPLWFSKQQKSSIPWRVYERVVALMPFIAIIIGAHVAWQIKHNDGYNNPKIVHEYYSKQLKVLGFYTPGVDIIRIPTLPYDMTKMIADVFPISLISFMESYSVARRLAVKTNELHLLSASQELWANGIANLLASVCSGYPVSGSFSRSSLNWASGAKTPLSKIFCMIVIVIALAQLTGQFYYIPQAALAAVIFYSIYPLINYLDFWEAWKHSKKDFATMLVTFTFVFVYNTETGLAVGIGFSFFVYIVEVVASRSIVPNEEHIREHSLLMRAYTLIMRTYLSVSSIMKEFPNTAYRIIFQMELMSNAAAADPEIRLIRLKSNICFLTSWSIKEAIGEIARVAPTPPSGETGFQDRIFFHVSSFFDFWLKPTEVKVVTHLPKAIVIDFTYVRIIDLTGLLAIHEAFDEGRLHGVRYAIFNVHPPLVPQLIKFGITNDSSSEATDLDSYLAASALPVVDRSGAETSCATENNKEEEHVDSSEKLEKGDYGQVNLV